MERCALNGTVVASVLPSASAAIMPLARSAIAAGFGCVVVQPIESVTLTDDERRVLLLLDLPSKPLLPRSMWCNTSQYMARRRQFYRLRLWRIVLESGLDLLGVDATRVLLRNPLPAIVSLRTRDEAEHGSGVRPDMVGHTPGWFLKQFGLGVGMWLRSTEATRILLRRSEARVRGCQDEVVFTEELNWGDAVGNHSVLPCCHSDCLSKQFAASSDKSVAAAVRKPKERRGSDSAGPSCAADDAPPRAPPPPNATRHGWADPSKKNGTRRFGTSRAGLPLVQLAWRPEAYNTLAIAVHRFGRCTGRDVSCVGMHPDCPPPPPPFTRATALAGKRQEAEKARLRGIRHRAEREAKAAAKAAKAAGRSARGEKAFTR